MQNARRVQGSLLYCILEGTANRMLACPPSSSVLAPTTSQSPFISPGLQGIGATGAQAGALAEDGHFSICER